jgi:hypothetical protein
MANWLWRADPDGGPLLREELMPETHAVCVLHESKGPLIYPDVAVDAASVRACLLEDGQIVYRDFYLTGERDAAGRPIYRGRLA